MIKTVTLIYRLKSLPFVKHSTFCFLSLLHCTKSTLATWCTNKILVSINQDLYSFRPLNNRYLEKTMLKESATKRIFITTYRRIFSSQPPQASSDQAYSCLKDKIGSDFKLDLIANVRLYPSRKQLNGIFVSALHCNNSSASQWTNYR